MSCDNNSVFLVTLAVAAMFGLVFGLVQLFGDPPPCSDYSYKISRLPFNHKTATCNKWDGMAMNIDRGLLGGTLVNCYCPEP